MGHFARECRSLRNQESRPRNQYSSRRTVNVKDTSSKAMVEIDEEGFNWSYMADDEVPTNMALMGFSDSEVQNSKTCSNTCLKSFETLKTQYDNLRIEFNKSAFDLATYKKGVGFASYNVVAPPPIGLFAIPTIDLSNFGLEEFQHPEFKGQSSLRAATPVSAARSINTVAPKPLVNVAKPRQIALQKSHSLSRRPFYQQTTLKNINLNKKINTAKVNSVNTAKGNRVTSVVGKQGINVDKSSTCWVWRPKIKGDPQDTLKDTWIFDSGYSRHMTGHKSYLIDYQESDRRFVAFVSGSKGGKMTGKDFTYGLIWTNLYKEHHGKMYCLVVTDDYSKFSWVFFLAKKDETSGILKDFITGIENQSNHKVKIIRCDNKTEYKNYEMNKFCGIKGIKREFSNARTPQQNGVAERKNMTLIEAARAMLADSLLPIPFWAEAVNTACYVQNRVLVTKPHNKTPYELLIGRTHIISFMGPFGYPVTILNTLDHLGKFDGKANEGFLVGYSINSNVVPKRLDLLP
uniref:Putative ribonuclease H-like domain-containing protein n=1 Tax=Tanacetum cinerariifolium TaxID=118510 RepID=A0A6L2NWY1_TANCI|nr:putative ribonuclease H-like domain-containing protein [Tanacetum cinerariifolium]